MFPRSISREHSVRLESQKNEKAVTDDRQVTISRGQAEEIYLRIYNGKLWLTKNDSELGIINHILSPVTRQPENQK